MLEAARAVEGDAQSRVVPSQPVEGGEAALGICCLSITLCPRGKGEIPQAGVGTAWAAACGTAGSWKNAFPPHQGSSTD